MSNINKIRELETEYISNHQKSKQLYEKALRCYASGVSHDVRLARPFPIYATKAKGTKKWDVDGNEYIDYVMGHGALLFGYANEQISAAQIDQIPKGVHMGANTELEIVWAELIQEIVPSARGSTVRGVACGGEACSMAIRLARNYTGKDKVVLNAGSYGGKGDTNMLAKNGPPFGYTNVRGIPSSVSNEVIIVPSNNLEAAETAFATGDVACMMIMSNSLYKKDYLLGLRKLTKQYGVIFIMDEVISGFRYAAGGAQEYYGVIPDLTTLGKIIGGGAPIGAICGKREIMELYSFKDEYWNKFIRISVGGTWNSQPLSIVGGIEAMKIIKSERNVLYPRIYNIGKRLSNSFNEQAEDLGVAAIAWGLPTENPTLFGIDFLNKTPEENKYLWQTGPTSLKDYWTKAGFMAGDQANYTNYLVLIKNGIFSLANGSRFYLCSEYTEEDLQKTEEAFYTSLRALKENRLVGLVD